MNSNASLKGGEEAGAAEETVLCTAMSHQPPAGALHGSFAGQAAFWNPRYLINSPMLGQIPFIFWLMAAVRPRTVVQLGVGDGMVYMALCQAIERFCDNGICLGVQSNEPLIQPLLRAQHDSQYSDFSELFEGRMVDGVSRFDYEIDLLVLNEMMTAESIAAMQDSLLPRLSDRSVVLICHPQAIFPDADQRAKLFPELHRPIVISPVSASGQPIEIVLSSEDQREQLKFLLDQLPGKPSYMETRPIFNRLGRALEVAQEADALRSERDHLKELLQLTKATVQQLEVELSSKSKDAEAAKAAEALEVSQRAEVLAQLHDLEKELLAKQREAKAVAEQRDQIAQERLGDAKQVSELKAEIATLNMQRQEILEYQKSVQLLEEEKRRLELEVSALRASHEERVRDIVVLTKDFDGRRKEMQADNKNALQKIEALDQKIASIYHSVGVEIGCIVNALLPKMRGGVLKRVVPLTDQAQLLVANEIVDPEWYLAQNPDVAAAGMDPAVHYILHGAMEGRLPRRVHEGNSR